MEGISARVFVQLVFCIPSICVIGGSQRSNAETLDHLAVDTSLRRA